MGRLTTIDDIERQKAAADEEEMRAAQEAFGGSASGAAHGEDSEPEESAEDIAQQPAEHSATAQARAGKDAHQAPQAAKSTAQQELDFHGLDNLEKHSSGHVALIVIAVVIVIAAALKIAGVY